MPLSRVTFLAELATAKPGDRIIYHTGSLGKDRQLSLYSEAVEAVASAAWEAYRQGRVTLVQKKLGPMTHDYIAIKKEVTAPVIFEGAYRERLK